MNKSFAILASVLLGAAAFGVTAVSAQTKSSATKCGPEGFSGKDMNYASVPCNAGEQATAQPCKPEGFSRQGHELRQRALLRRHDPGESRLEGSEDSEVSDCIFPCRR